MPLAITVHEMNELADQLPQPVVALLAKRHFLVLDIILGDEGEYEPKIMPLKNRVEEGVVDHKGVHILHRDNRPRFICARGSRPDTAILHPDSFPEAYNAGLLELTRYPHLRPAISRAAVQYLDNGMEDVDHSIFLATAIAQELFYQGINPAEERRILEAHQSAVLRAAEPNAYSHPHQAPKSAKIKQALHLGKYVPHFKKITPETNLNQREDTIWIKDVITRR